MELTPEQRRIDLIIRMHSLAHNIQSSIHRGTSLSGHERDMLKIIADLLITYSEQMEMHDDIRKSKE